MLHHNPFFRRCAEHHIAVCEAVMPRSPMDVVVEKIRLKPQHQITPESRPVPRRAAQVFAGWTMEKFR